MTVKHDTTFLLYRYAATPTEIVYLAFRLYKPVLTFALFHTKVCCKSKRQIKKQTFDISFDVSTEQFMPGNLIKSATHRCQCYINIDIRWYIELHMRAPHQPTCFQQYQLSQLVQEILHLHQQLYTLLFYANHNHTYRQ